MMLRFTLKTEVIDVAIKHCSLLYDGLISAKWIKRPLVRRFTLVRSWMSSCGQSAHFWDEMPRQRFVCSAEWGRHEVTDLPGWVLPKSDIRFSEYPLRPTHKLTVTVFVKRSYLMSPVLTPNKNMHVRFHTHNFLVLIKAGTIVLSDKERPQIMGFQEMVCINMPPRFSLGTDKSR